MSVGVAVKLKIFEGSLSYAYIYTYMNSVKTHSRKRFGRSLHQMKASAETDEGFGRNVYENVFFLSSYIYFYYALRLSL